MLHQTFLFLGQLWQLFEVSQILEFLRYMSFFVANRFIYKSQRENLLQIFLLIGKG